MYVKAWGFEGSGTTPPEPQKAFGGTAWAIPGKIEMENFDEPGTGRGAGVDSYSENDSENHGDSDYRDGTGVDLYKKATGVIVGYNQSGEWLEYTVNVKEAGDYTVYASVATDNTSAGFSLSIDGEPLAEIPVSGASWEDFVKVNANVALPAGEHILRFEVTGDWFDIDYINFVAGKDAPEDTSGKESIGNSVSFSVAGSHDYRVFNVKGTQVGVVSLNGSNASEALRMAGFKQGLYMLRSMDGSKKFMAKVVR